MSLIESTYLFKGFDMDAAPMFLVIKGMCGVGAVRQLRELVKWTRQGGPGNQGRDQAVRNAINMRRGAWNEVQVCVPFWICHSHG